MSSRVTHKFLIMRITLSKIVFLVLVFTSFVSCSKNEESAPVVNVAQLSQKYEYVSEEEQVMALINEHRTSLGLNELKVIDYISFESEKHDKYMIATGQMNHNNFQDRYESIVNALGAQEVGENLAYNYASAQSVVNAWLNSPSHKVILEGNYTHFGISIRPNAEGKKYYTNIFMRK